jgi:hypothetical protein
MIIGMQKTIPITVKQAKVPKITRSKPIVFRNGLNDKAATTKARAMIVNSISMSR